MSVQYVTFIFNGITADRIIPLMLTVVYDAIRFFFNSVANLYSAIC